MKLNLIYQAILELEPENDMIAIELIQTPNDLMETFAEDYTPSFLGLTLRMQPCTKWLPLNVFHHC